MTDKTTRCPFIFGGSACTVHVSHTRFSEGCDHTLETCRDRFNNLANFGGYPVPPREPECPKYVLEHGPGAMMGPRYRLLKNGEEIGFLYDLSEEDAIELARDMGGVITTEQRRLL